MMTNQGLHKISNYQKILLIKFNAQKTGYKCSKLWITFDNLIITKIKSRVYPQDDIILMVRLWEELCSFLMI